MMNDIGRNRAVLTAAAAFTIIVGLLLVGGLPQANVPASTTGGTLPNGRIGVADESGEQFVVRDYSEFGDASIADLPSSDWLALLAGMLLKLALVIAVFYAAIWAFRRYLYRGRSPVLGSKPVSILGTQNLSPNRTVYVLEVGRKVLVVGATQTQLSLLTEVTDPGAIDELRALNTETNPAEHFSWLLDSATRQFRVRGIASSDVPAGTPLKTEG